MVVGATARVVAKSLFSGPVFLPPAQHGGWAGFEMAHRLSPGMSTLADGAQKSEATLGWAGRAFNGFVMSI